MIKSTAQGISKYEYDLRKKISERLHDDIGGSIIALKMKCSDKKEMVNEVKLLDDIYNNVRSLSSDLDIQHKFSQTIENGIDILVNEMCSSFKKTTVNVVCGCTEQNEYRDTAHDGNVSKDYFGDDFCDYMLFGNMFFSQRYWSATKRTCCN